MIINRVSKIPEIGIAVAGRVPGARNVPVVGALLRQADNKATEEAKKLRRITTLREGGQVWSGDDFKDPKKLVTVLQNTLGLNPDKSETIIIDTVAPAAVGGMHDAKPRAKAESVAEALVENGHDVLVPDATKELAVGHGSTLITAARAMQVNHAMLDGRNPGNTITFGNAALLAESPSRLAARDLLAGHVLLSDVQPDPHHAHFVGYSHAYALHE